MSTSSTPPKPPPAAKTKKGSQRVDAFARKSVASASIKAPAKKNNTIHPTKSKSTRSWRRGRTFTMIDAGTLDDPSAFAMNGHANACIRPLCTDGAIGIYSPAAYTRAVDSDYVHVKLKNGQVFQGRLYDLPDDTKIAIVADAPAYHGAIIDIGEIELAAVLVEVRMPVRWGPCGATKDELGVIESERLINSKSFSESAFELFAATGQCIFDRWPGREELEFARMKKRK